MKSKIFVISSDICHQRTILGDILYRKYDKWDLDFEYFWGWPSFRQDKSSSSLTAVPCLLRAAVLMCKRWNHRNINLCILDFVYPHIWKAIKFIETTHSQWNWLWITLSQFSVDYLSLGLHLLVLWNHFWPETEGKAGPKKTAHRESAALK